jgi:hypothetical protein
MYSAWEVCLPVNNVGDTVEKDVVGEDNLRVVDVDRAIRENGNGQVVALERRHGDVAQRRRENDVVGDEVVLEDFLKAVSVGTNAVKSEMLRPVCSAPSRPNSMLRSAVSSAAFRAKYPARYVKSWNGAPKESTVSIL